MEKLFAFNQVKNDPLSGYLETIRVADAVVRKLEFVSPWEIRVAPGTPAIYMIVNGSCALRMEQGRPILLSGGDLAILIHGTTHALENQSQDNSVAGSDHSDTSTLISIHFSWHGGQIEPLLSELPQAIRIQSQGGPLVSWIMNTLQLVNQTDLPQNAPIGDILNRVAHFFLVQGIRSHIAAGEPGGCQALRTIVQGRIGPALFLIHTQPEAAWSLQSLARRCGMCRSAFAREFKCAVGQPPMAYLSERRMHRACELLIQGIYRIKEIALRSGYQSLPAFSSAFGKWAGATPVNYRRRQTLLKEREPMR